MRPRRGRVVTAAVGDVARVRKRDARVVEPLETVLAKVGHGQNATGPAQGGTRRVILPDQLRRVARAAGS